MAGADDPGSVPFDPYQVPVRLAATLMLVRDGATGLEVAMLRRSLTASFVGGAHVFPGGAVDPQDASAAVAARCRGLDVAAANEVLRVPQDGFAYWVAAVRESFEEAGLLVAEHDDGTPVDLSDADVASRFVTHRGDVHAGRRKFADVLAEEDLYLPMDRVHPWSHWVTPIGPPRRFDTRFFVAAAPAGQEPLHDEHETIDSVWLSPLSALREFAEGRITIITPTIKSLEAIGRFPTVDTLLGAAAPRGAIAAVIAPPVG